MFKSHSVKGATTILYYAFEIDTFTDACCYFESPSHLANLSLQTGCPGKFSQLPESVRQQPSLQSKGAKDGLQW